MAEALERRERWNTVYMEKAPNQVSWFQAAPEPSLGLIKQHVGPAASVIDVGGGASNLVDGLLQAGFHDLTVLDLSAAALDAAKNRLAQSGSHVIWLVADATIWTPTRTYDVWHDRAALHFLTEEELNAKPMSSDLNARSSQADMQSLPRLRLMGQKDAVACLSYGTTRPASLGCSAHHSIVSARSATIMRPLGKPLKLSNSASFER